MLKISWTGRVKNEVLHRIRDGSNILHTMKRKTNWIGNMWRSNYLSKTLLKEG